MAAAEGEDGLARLFHDIPLITKCYTISTLVITFACNFDIISQFHLYLNPTLIIQRFQLWRLVTPFLYAGPFTFGTVFNLLFTYRYSRLLEDHCFHRRRADYLYMIIVVSSIILFLAAPMTDMIFLGNSLSHAILYLWCRRNAFQRVMVLGLFVMRADQVHFVLVGLSILTGSSLLTSDLIALIAGHVYFFLEDVFPRQRLGFKILKTPWILKALFNELDEEPNSTIESPNPAAEVVANENAINDAEPQPQPLFNDANNNPAAGVVPDQHQFLN